MNPKELQELDAWIAEHVMGLKRCKRIDALKGGEFFIHRTDGVFITTPKQLNRIELFSPTTDSAAAMLVLERCGIKAEKSPCAYIGKVGEEWIIGLEDLNIEAVAATLSLAICLFARELFK